MFVVKKIMAILISVLILISGCTKISTGPEREEQGENKGAIVENIGYDDLENIEVGIIKGEVRPVSSLNRTIANASFVPQDENKVEFEYQPNQDDQIIQLIDSKGWEWTFSFPKYALTRNTQITFMPLSKIQLDSLPDLELSGFLMEPDGLEFLIAPTVTIKKENESTEAFLLSSAHDGSGVVFHPASSREGQLQAKIPHFSAWYNLPEKQKERAQIERLKEMVSQQHEDAIKAAKDLLKKPITVPEPPNIGFECLDKDKFAQASAYAKLVNEEEEEILNSLISALFRTNLLGDDVDFELAQRVAMRTMVKADKLFSTYQGQPEKLLPVFFATATAHKQYLLLGGEFQELQFFIPWAEKTKNYYMDRLVNKHDYRAIGAAFESLRFTALVGGEVDINEIFNALIFKLKIKIVFIEEWDGGHDMIISEGEGEMLPMAINPENMWGSNNVFLKGDIMMKSTLSGEYFSKMKYTADKYTVSAEIRNWDPCKTQTCDIWVSTLGLEGEQIGYYGDGEFEVFSEVLIWDHSDENFSEEMENGFHVKLNNLGESAVIQTFSGEDKVFGGVKLDILFDLVHLKGKKYYK